MELTAKQVKDLKQVLEIQGNKGNWDYDQYMRGMYNGMELMMAIIEGRDPAYRSMPKKYVRNSKVTAKLATEEAR